VSTRLAPYPPTPSTERSWIASSSVAYAVNCCKTELPTRTGTISAPERREEVAEGGTSGQELKLVVREDADDVCPAAGVSSIMGDGNVS